MVDNIAKSRAIPWMYLMVHDSDYWKFGYLCSNSAQRIHIVHCSLLYNISESSKDTRAWHFNKSVEKHFALGWMEMRYPHSWRMGFIHLLRIFKSWTDEITFFSVWKQKWNLKRTFLPENSCRKCEISVTSGAFLCKSRAQIDLWGQAFIDEAPAISGDWIPFEFAPLINRRGVTMVTWTTHRCHGLTFVAGEGKERLFSKQTCRIHLCRSRRQNVVPK